MPTRDLIPNKRKSFGHDFLDECMEGGQKRRCFGIPNFVDGCELKQAESVAEMDLPLCYEENMEEEDIGSNVCDMMSTENNNNGSQYNNNNNNSNNNHYQHSRPHEKLNALQNGCLSQQQQHQQHQPIETRTQVPAPTDSSSSPTPSYYYEQLNVSLGPADRFCIGGTFGYRPGLNRSYCRPSWDAMADLRTYVSDYY